MKWIIFFCVLIIVLFSGCLDLISTREKQLCLSSTDYSETSIYFCSKSSECYKKVNSAEWIISEKIPIDAKNQILIYKNNIASSIYYFNKAKIEIQNINEFCSGEKDLQIIKSINNLFFYISKVFSYEDQSFQKSIEILKNYTIYLQANGVEKITEEEIYTDFIILNQNLNELRNEDVGEESYISLLKIEAQNASELAKNFGFTKSYMSNVNYVDIYAYYSEYIDNPEQELKLPIISKSSDFVFSKLSTFENFRKINANLSKADNYNLYILFDKHLGANNSLLSKFIELNNKINTDLKGTFDKIDYLEKDIDTDINYLDTDNQNTYLEYKQKYSRNQIGFGIYLSKLKEFNLILEEAKTQVNNDSSIINSKLKDCDVIIKEGKDYNNWYFKEIIRNYTAEENGYVKLEYCQKIKDALSNRNCLSNYSKLVNLGYIEDINANNEFECIDILNQFNYTLEDDSSIELYYSLISENKELIRNIKSFDLDFEQQILVLDYEDKMEEYKKYANYKIIINIDDYLSELNKINKQLLELWQNCISETILDNYEITYSDEGYLLEIENPGDILITDFCFKPEDINLNEISSADSSLEINKSEICAGQLERGINKYKIEYSNHRTTSTKVINLNINKSLLETVIKNDVVGIFESLNLGQVELVDSINYQLNEKQEVEYITQKENRILYYLQILEKTNIETNTTPETNDAIIVKKFKLKNIYPAKVCGEVSVTDCENCVALIKENGITKNANAYKEYGKLSIDLCFEIAEEKVIEIDLIEEISFVNGEIQDLLSRINTLNNCEFNDISSKSKSLFPEIPDLLIKDNYSFEEINKIYSFEERLNILEKEYKQKLELINNVNLIISQILNKQLTAEDETEIATIEELLNTDPTEAYKRAIALENSILERNKNQDGIKINDFKNKIDNLIALGKTTNTIDSETVAKLNALQFSETDQLEFKNVENEINNKIKDKSKEANEYVRYFEEINKKEILDIIEAVQWEYSDITLADLYKVKYYPEITVDDAARLKKKLSYLDTVSFKESSNEFSGAFSVADYSDTLQGINQISIDRLKDLNKEINLVSEGLIQFQTDATSELEKLNNKGSKTKENTQKIQIIKNDFENKKYLKVIKNSRLIIQNSQPAQKINYQLFTIIGLFSIFTIAVVVFGKKSTKKLSKEEQKQKILRHY